MLLLWSSSSPYVVSMKSDIDLIEIIPQVEMKGLIVLIVFCYVDSVIVHPLPVSICSHL